jgi:hypothetical protein
MNIKKCVFITFYERSNFQKIFFIDFLDELGLFIEEKPICTKKKFPSPAVCRLRIRNTLFIINL